jgi:hypothetical protein
MWKETTCLKMIHKIVTIMEGSRMKTEIKYPLVQNCATEETTDIKGT